MDSDLKLKKQIASTNLALESFEELLGSKRNGQDMFWNYLMTKTNEELGILFLAACYSNK